MGSRSRRRLRTNARRCSHWSMPHSGRKNSPRRVTGRARQPSSGWRRSATLYVAEQALITTRLAEQSNRVTLYKVLGGGWQENGP